MTLFLDACSIIYLLESHQQQGQKTRLLITQALPSKTQLMVSRLSFLECRVFPLKENNTDLLESYKRFFCLPNVKIIELTADVMDIATDLRVKYPSSLRTPDALQLACALSANANQFLTGDKKLSVIQEINVVIV
ncbi:MAG: PIN domain-containing protein [Methylovulum sp.]|nr:PIN domain-containing protein [Methylovulum sp.]MDD2725511.1 PIN domain-containing protein [Methylovulum sp.]MDD5126107.1 PIN domain-containing protein [Methylovulum sp.]